MIRSQPNYLFILVVLDKIENIRKKKNHFVFSFLIFLKSFLRSSIEDIETKYFEQ